MLPHSSTFGRRYCPFLRLENYSTVSLIKSLLHLQGTEAAQTHAVDIIKAAVTRYKYLAEGPCNGQRVSHVHTIFGIDFFYSPPPKSIVPHAAGLDPLEDW